ncbi:metallophosphoesterase [Vibrio barjaei]|uniref:metallophosphoesterase n=1 Tax=Vibrio barjaei TaxID=1676683 RepID=UPI0022841138|nr:metallophosphoesterase [Vibrio barjaei]MCY9873860.1 metallophosphoesterase [Vibrio barjaei]
MNLQIISDFHEEHHGHDIAPYINKDADIVILAGDISTGTTGVSLALDSAELHPSITHVVVFGNHELYDLDYAEYLALVNMWNDLAPNLHFLENRSISLENGIEIFGGIGWSNLNTPNHKELHERVQDFSAIDYYGKPVTIEDFRHFNNEYWSNAQKWFKTSTGKTKILVSHFPQSTALKHKQYEKNDLDYYFCADRDLEIKEAGEHGVSLMVSGHTHDSFSTSIQGVRQESRQVGYPFESNDALDAVGGLNSMIVI